MSLVPRSKYDYGDLISLDEFAGAIACGAFIDYDGDGYWASEEWVDESLPVTPSGFRKENAPEWATHVLWFNR